MERNGKIIVVVAPQLLKKKLCLTAGVDEYQGRLVRLDMCVDLSEGMARRMTGPWQMLFGIKHRDDRLGAGLRGHQIQHALGYLAVVQPEIGGARRA